MIASRGKSQASKHFFRKVSATDNGLSLLLGTSGNFGPSRIPNAIHPQMIGRIFANSPRSPRRNADHYRTRTDETPGPRHRRDEGRASVLHQNSFARSTLPRRPPMFALPPRYGGATNRSFPTLGR